MSDTLVVGFDGTDGARAALDEALALAKDLGGQIHLVFAFEAPRLGGELRDLDEAIAERAREVLEQGTHHAAAAGAQVTTEHRKSDPAEALIATAGERDARYIVVGSYGERPLKSALVGSTPTPLLHLSSARCSSCARPNRLVDMRAVVLTKHGDYSVLQVQDRPSPPMKPGHVRIKVHAAV